jgi:Rrf2 family iron-sulfur cluster assembly transcriptional regulator
MYDFLSGITLDQLVKEQLDKGVVVEESLPQIKRAITPMQVVKPIRVNAPNSVFALAASLSKT